MFLTGCTTLRHAPPQPVFFLRNPTNGEVAGPFVCRKGESVRIDGQQFVIARKLTHDELTMEEIQSIKIPLLEFQKTPLDEAIRALQRQYKKLSGRTGSTQVLIYVDMSEWPGSTPGDDELGFVYDPLPTVTIPRREDVSLAVVLTEICTYSTGGAVTWHVDGQCVKVTPRKKTEPIM